MPDGLEQHLRGHRRGRPSADDALRPLRWRCDRALARRRLSEGHVHHLPQVCKEGAEPRLFFATAKRLLQSSCRCSLGGEGCMQVPLWASGGAEGSGEQVLRRRAGVRAPYCS